MIGVVCDHVFGSWYLQVAMLKWKHIIDGGTLLARAVETGARDTFDAVLATLEVEIEGVSMETKRNLVDGDQTLTIYSVPFVDTVLRHPNR